MSIIVTSLNPSIDWQITAPSFVYGGLNRVQSRGRYASGKGINVCAALKNLGLNPLCVGVNYREKGEIITNTLDEWGIRHDFITVDGEVRTNIKLYDTQTGNMTELNQPGGIVPEGAVSGLVEKICSTNALSSASILILSGSIPPGVPSDIYRQLCEAWPGTVILDTEGEPLRKAMEGKKPPFCIKPNIYELESSFNVKLSTKEDITAFCRELMKTYKVQMICVSMGAEGAVLATDSVAYFLPALDIPVQGVQGAGDAMVAGVAYGLSHNAPEPQLLRIASAAAAASVIREGSLMCTRADFEKFLRKLPEPEIITYGGNRIR